jgi:hypothetical protein
MGFVSRLATLDARRLWARARYPTVGDVVLLAVPLALLAAGLSAAREALAPQLSTPGEGGALGMLLSAPVAFLTYSVLFRGADTGLLRRLGVPPGALYVERAARLLVAALALALVPIGFSAIGDQPLTTVLRVSLTAAVVAWALGVASASLAAAAMARRRQGSGWGCLTVGMWDGELAAIAPLVYAPLVPLLGGSAAGAVAWGGGLPVLLGLWVLALGMAWLGGRWWEAALPRFGPRVLEMAFEPPPPTGTGELGLGRGVSRLLPRATAAVWARDAVVAARRYGWATRIVWPVALLALVLLARWGEQPATRGWVAAAVVAVWLLQMAATIALGTYERATRRWVDRSLGITPGQRLLGRWLFGWGLSLWLGVPVALAWQWWGGGAGWPWLVLGAGTAGIGAVGSLAAAGWR